MKKTFSKTDISVQLSRNGIRDFFKTYIVTTTSKLAGEVQKAILSRTANKTENLDIPIIT